MYFVTVVFDPSGGITSVGVKPSPPSVPLSLDQERCIVDAFYFAAKIPPYEGEPETRYQTVEI
jgi:hypothetical protein